MAILDLSQITKAYLTLIEESFNISAAWSGTAPTISPAPPDRLSGDSLGFYLYHFQEDAHFKNMPPLGRDHPPVARQPMALQLFYQLSSSSAADDGSGTLTEQQMMGIAMKALHDTPTLTDTTRINGVTVFPVALLDHENVLHTTLQPMPHTEAVNYWSAGTAPLRLAAYYQVGVVMLEPEPVRIRPGRVAVYGVHTFLQGAPRIDSRSNTLTFNVPGEASPRQVVVRPAQVPFGDRVTFAGSGLVGDETALLLRHPRWPEPREVGLDWAVAPSGDRLIASAGEQTLAGDDLLPGMHAAIVRVRRNRTMPDGTIRVFEHLSNDCPFTLAPRIDSVGLPVAQGIFEVQGYRFDHPSLKVTRAVYLGAEALTVDNPNALAQGTYGVVTPPNALPLLRMRLPAGLESGRPLPLRIFINGAESPPRWIKVP